MAATHLASASAPSPPAYVESGECKHLHTINQHGQTYCSDCCEELISFCKEETRFFEDASTALASDRKAIKSIRKELDALPLPETIKDRADRIYGNRVGSNTYRSKVRQEVKFSCIFDAFKEEGIYKDPCEIATMVGIKRRGMTRGIARCSFLWTGKDKTNNVSITAIHLVPDMMTRNCIEFEQSHLDDVAAIYEYTKDRSELLNRSKPQSIAAALIYFYMLKVDETRKISKADVAKNCGISIMTMMKIATELEAICGNSWTEG